MKHTKPTVGDIVAIPLNQLGYGVGIILHLSSYFKNGMILGLFDQLYQSIEEIDVQRINTSLIDTPNYTSTQIVKKGIWPVVGNNADLASSIGIPLLRVVNTLFQGDEILRQITVEEEQVYTTVLGQGYLSVEEKLRKHFTK